jgi:hypothetical protein
MQALIDLHIGLDLSLESTPWAQTALGSTTAASTVTTLTGNDGGLDLESISNMAQSDFESWAAYSLSQIF